MWVKIAYVYSVEATKERMQCLCWSNKVKDEVTFMLLLQYSMHSVAPGHAQRSAECHRASQQCTPHT